MQFIKMIEQNRLEKELSLQNTPLQNLKNILSDVDASIESKAINRFAFTQITGGKGIPKANLQEAIDNLSASADQYISPAYIGNTLYLLSLKDHQEKALTAEDFRNNININILTNILRAFI